MARIKEIKAEFGISQGTGPGTWIKALASITIEMDKPEDQNMKDDIWESAWDRVTDEVSTQLTKLNANPNLKG